MTKRNNVIFRILTWLLIPAFGIGSITEVLENPKSAEVVTSLGYPAYLSPLLGVARILALIAIITPKDRRPEEWAYAGLVFDIIGATYSQIATGNPFINMIFPIIALGLVLGAYYFYHKRLKNLLRNNDKYYQQIKNKKNDKRFAI